MKYLLLHNLENNIKDKLISNYIKDNYQIIYKDENNIILKNYKDKLLDEEKYIKIVISVLKRNNLINTSNSKIIDLTKAFEYAKEKGKYNIFNNKFDWYIRNIIIKELY